MQRPPEALLGDRWQLITPIGEGAMGEVWHGRHSQLGHDVAVKLMKPDAAQDQNLVARFRREARIAAQLRSKYIVRVEDFGVASDGRPYLVMEFLRGETLSSVLDKTPRPDRAFVARVVQHIAAACDTAHAAGIVHRDLKPENCFVVRDEDGTHLVKVLDFGVAKVTDNVFVTQSGVVTGSHALLGTPVYMSPEQARGEPNLDGRSDLWSLGVIAYEMLCGRIPFEANTLAQVLYAVLAGPIAPPSAFDPTLPPALDAWTQRALHRDRTQRFSSGKELARALAQSLGLSQITPTSLAPYDATDSAAPLDRTLMAPSQSALSAPHASAPPASTHPSASATAQRAHESTIAAIYMPSAAPASPDALTWSGAGTGTPWVQPSVGNLAPSVSNVARPMATAASLPPPMPGSISGTYPASLAAPHARASVYPPPSAGSIGPSATLREPTIARRKQLHNMGFVFLAMGAVSAAALGSVVRSRQRAARAENVSVVIAPPTPLAPSSSTQVSNGTIAPSTLPHGMPTKVTPGSTPERQRDERAAPVVSVLQSSPERVRGADRSPSSRSQPVRTAANASPDAPSRDEDASSRRAGSNGSTHATNTQQSQPSAERSFDSL